MLILLGFTSIFLIAFATAVMSYISMAAPIGPWIESTLVLVSMIVFNLFYRKVFRQGARPAVNAQNCTSTKYSEALGLTTAAGGIAGILATAFGFSIPALFFIDPEVFKSWMAQPVTFCFYLSGLALASGSFGLLIASIFQKRLIFQEKLAFPIGELIYKMISVQNQAKKLLFLILGFIGTGFFLLLQVCSKLIPQKLALFKSRSLLFIKLPELVIPFNLLPMFLAVGFVTGHVIVLPLFVGLLSKVFCLEPLFYVYPYIYNFINTNIWPFLNTMQLSSFKSPSLNDFTIAFCSGMILYSSMVGFLSLPKTLYRETKNIFGYPKNLQENVTKSSVIMHNLPWIELIIALLINFCFLTYFNFSILSQLYLLAFTFVCTYQLLVIAGKIGLAPLGRFATFVMVPGMILFGFNAIQLTFVSTFVEAVGGVSCDALFGRKMASLMNIKHNKILLFQWLGLLFSALIIGLIFWLLISTFGLGSVIGSLPVTKAAARALLINVKNFDILVLFFGFIFGYLLKFTKVNAMLVLGGILMPINLSVMLIIGGLLTYLTTDREHYYPLFSGIFAANSLWMLIEAFIAKICSI